MTDLPNPNPQTPKTIEGNCQKCQSPISVPFPPLIPNENIIISSILIPHEKGTTCSTCGTYHNLMIAPSQISLALVQMPNPQIAEEKKILPFDKSHLDKLPKIQ